MLSNKPFGNVKQWGYLVKDLDQAMDCWVNQLGVGPFWGFRNVALKSVYMGKETDIVIDVGLAYQNGVQIELIHQTSGHNIASPYSAFYGTADTQLFQQVAYHCTDINAAREKAVSLGLQELGYIESQMQTRYYYFSSPALKGIVVELMEVDDMMVGAFEMCANEADSWDGTDPYRLISM